MPRKPGNLNPDSAAGNARLGTGRGSNAGRSQPSGASRAVPAPKKFTPPAGIKVKTSFTEYTDASGKTFTLNPGGRWQGNRVPDKPLSSYKVSDAYKVTNTNTGATMTFGNTTKEDAIKKFLEGESVYSKLTQSFGAAIKKAK